jgi:hypothetical protein
MAVAIILSVLEISDCGAPESSPGVEVEAEAAEIAAEFVSVPGTLQFSHDEKIIA